MNKKIIGNILFYGSHIYMALFIYRTGLAIGKVKGGFPEATVFPGIKVVRNEVHK